MRSVTEFSRFCFPHRSRESEAAIAPRGVVATEQRCNSLPRWPLDKGRAVRGGRGSSELSATDPRHTLALGGEQDRAGGGVPLVLDVPVSGELAAPRQSAAATSALPHRLGLRRIQVRHGLAAGSGSH